ncbi:MAG: twin-arginine translocase TatA/TatE family subunit [Deltaproteobacteria bacterium]|nr:MAG: twin-arginine translocase TatA/TatE family subunit [Deltaproteobacteria bacterium]
MFGLGTAELVLILAIVLIIFGAGKIPKIAGDLGKAIKSFRRSIKGVEGELAANPEVPKEIDKS